MRMDRLPDHLLLSNPPDAPTLSYASALLDRLDNPHKPTDGLTWAQILAEEPLEGEHWALSADSESDSDLSPWDDDPELLRERASASSAASEYEAYGEDDADVDKGEDKEGERDVELAIPQRYDHRDKIEEIQAQQYWRADWKPDLDLDKEFDIGDPPAYKIGGPSSEKYIYEHDAVREVLMALQGRQNLLFSWTHQGGNTFSFTPSQTAPRLAHYTLNAQLSLLRSFANTATTVHHLRKFVASVYSRPGRVRTIEAFAEAVERELCRFEGWCAAREEDIVLAQNGLDAGSPRTVVSLLSLEKRLRDEFGRAYEVLLDVSRRAMRRATSRSAHAHADDDTDEVWILSELPTRAPPALVAAFLLDALFASAQTFAGMGDTVVPTVLLRVFARAAAPVWAMMQAWVGAGRVEAEEFFVEDNELVLADPEFWGEGYTVRGEGDEGRASVPGFLEGVVGMVVSAGKSVGLLRALGLDVDGVHARAEWRSFSAVLDGEVGEGHVSADVLSQVVYDELVAPCRTAQTSLTRVLFEECEMMRHLGAVENLYLMMRGDDMTHFANVLFGKMDTGQQWSDFHFLNTSFSEIVSSHPGPARWIDSALVRLSYRGTRTTNRTVRALEGLQVEYAVPFPLTYVLGPRVLSAYNVLFVFLLQLRRAKGVLDSILVFYAMRSKLSWFVNTLLNFVGTHVLHAQVALLHTAVHKAESLDDVIRLHEEHLEKICGRCFLRENTAALHRAVTSVLDMSLYFSDCFVAFAGDTTHDISRAYLLLTRRHRSRQQRRLRRNVIGFSQSLIRPEDDSESDSDEDGEMAPEPSFSVAASVSLAEEGFFIRLDKMSSDLDGLVKFIRRGVESLAAGAGESGQVFGVLAFSLEDWDR
ncbi:hypothetical protein GLOTRDRAFT_70178 [Gloeophyllum trabeum ATCC 11539]|uniref:Spindle pole body component n=1 Tax=Gloeophyllum trabeum (strain ATCC 11539 / FP-39264 / Madison 617) TaxID=670483 RepID=S7QII7_GLOTA|nr:uncharacterized protein GLOTRDRAFT_70178 [Gloeophyllum trabeum ATCC 11539]EPQ59052.1 hypothetical protein GLOTRDRAFT_70178 [Gloeophyllum trabeum ATCC 11539]